MILFLIKSYILGSIDPGFIPRSDDDDELSSSNCVDFDNPSTFGDADAGCTKTKCPFILSDTEEEHGPNSNFSSDDSFDSTATTISTTTTTNPQDDDDTELGVVEEQDVKNQEY